MNKKLKKLMTVISLASVAVIGLVGCDTNGGNTDKHTHSFDNTKWVYDDEGNYHWHPANCEHTDQQGNRAKHKFNEVVLVAADCTTGGKVERTCPTCGYHDVVDVPALGHDTYQVPVKLPGCEKDGHTAYIACTRCDYTSGYKVLQKTNTHRFSDAWQFDNEYHWHPNICGCTRYEDEAQHTLNATGECTVCGYTPGAIPKIDFVLESTGSGGYTVMGLTEQGKAKTTIEIPESYGRGRITAIADFAFEDETGITEITLPNSVKVIGREVFSGCTNLEKVTLGNAVTSIGFAAFLNCAKLETINLPASLTAIKAGAFDGCSSLEEIELPEMLTELGEQAFGGCSALTEITIPAGIEVINHNTFQGCTALASVSFRGVITYIGDNAFARCTSLTSIDLGSKLWYIGQKAFYGSGLVTVNVVVSGQDGNYIGAGAFAECKSLKSATITTNIKRIYGELFAGCSALEELTLPFVGSHRDPTANVPFSTDFGFLFGTNAPKDTEKFTKVGEKYYIPTSLTTVTVNGGTIKANAFDGCTMIQHIYYADGVTVESTGWTGPVTPELKPAAD